MQRVIFSAILLVLMGMPRTAESAELDGAVVYQNNCSRCHQPRTPADLSPAGWQAVSFHMRVKAVLSRAEFQALEEFLVPEIVAPSSAASADGVLSNPLISEVCLTCHTSERIQDAVDAGRTEADWQTALTRMRAYAAPIDAEQAEQLSAWLAEQSP